MLKQIKYLSRALSLLIFAFGLVACGGGGAPAPVPTTAATPTLTFNTIKTFHFTWTDVNDATHYKLLENADGVSGFVQVGSDIPQGAQSVDRIVPLFKRINASYILQSCNTIGCADSSSVSVGGTLVSSIGYLKASNTDTVDLFGTAISLSSDGNTLAVGAHREDSIATGINGNQSSFTASDSGAVYVFTRSDSSWSQQAYVKASNTEAGDGFGTSVSLSGDGNTLAVGATGEDSNATGVNGDETDNSAAQSGSVYIFTRSGNNWSQQAYVKASNTDTGDRFSVSISLSEDGNTLAVGADIEDSNASGINGDQSDNSNIFSGAVYIFTRSGNNWSQQAYVKASNTEAGDGFGTSVSLSGDGNTLAVGATGEDSNATDVNGDQFDNSVGGSGAVYVFTRNVNIWSQQAYIKASNTEADDIFGQIISLSGDGNTIAVGALREDSNAAGVNGDETDNSASWSGAVYVFTHNINSWNQQSYIKASNTGGGEGFSRSISLSDDGNTLAVGAFAEGSNATGIDGDQSDNSASGSGAVYVFTRNGSIWSQQAYVKASNTEASDVFGRTLSLSGDGNTLAVGADGEDSNTTGIGSTPNDDGTADLSGAVYLY